MLSLNQELTQLNISAKELESKITAEFLIFTSKAGKDSIDVMVLDENCLNFVDKWLAENSHYEAFYSKHTEKELTEFINELGD